MKIKQNFFISKDSNKPGSYHNRFYDLAALAIVFFVLRLSYGYLFPNILTYDETYQIFEPAHFLAFGTGILPWEYYLGIRSWFLPGFVAGLMTIGSWFSDDPAIILLVPQILFVLMSLVPIITSYYCGLAIAAKFRCNLVIEKISPRQCAIALALMVGFWTENFLIASHGLSEILAGYLVFAAVGIFTIESLSTVQNSSAQPSSETKRKLFLGGLLLGFAFILRFHLGPAIIVVAVIAARGIDWQRWRYLLVAGMIPLVFATILDWFSLGTPLQSMWLNFQVNVIDQVSSRFGTTPWWQIILFPIKGWGWATPLMVMGIWRGAKYLRLALVTAIVILVTHGFIAHKEMRFIYPALFLFSFIGAVGWIDLCLAPNLFMKRIARLWRWRISDWLSRWQVNYFLRPVLTFRQRLYGLMVLWLLVSLSLWWWPGIKNTASRGHSFIEIFRQISQISPRPCGIALFRISIMVTPAQTGLSPSIRLYQVETEENLLNSAAAYDAILIGDQPDYQRLLSDMGYEKNQCFKIDKSSDRLLSGHSFAPNTCLWLRPIETRGYCNILAAKTPELGLQELPPQRWQYGQDWLLQLRSSNP